MHISRFHLPRDDKQLHYGTFYMQLNKWTQLPHLRFQFVKIQYIRESISLHHPCFHGPIMPWSDVHISTHIFDYFYTTGHIFHRIFTTNHILDQLEFGLSTQNPTDENLISFKRFRDYFEVPSIDLIRKYRSILQLEYFDIFASDQLNQKSVQSYF